MLSNQDWTRLGESHAPNIRVHFPDGHYTDGIDNHLRADARLYGGGGISFEY